MPLLQGYIECKTWGGELEDEEFFRNENQEYPSDHSYDRHTRLGSNAISFKSSEACFTD